MTYDCMRKVIISFIVYIGNKTDEFSRTVVRQHIPSRMAHFTFFRKNFFCKFLPVSVSTTWKLLTRKVNAYANWAWGCKKRNTSEKFTVELAASLQLLCKVLSNTKYYAVLLFSRRREWIFITLLVIKKSWLLYK